jgi:hypothetical protein
MKEVQPAGSKIRNCSPFQFSDFDTEKIFDTVQILGGGRTEEAATNIATLSGTLNLKDKTFTSASNFMIIKFRSDEVGTFLHPRLCPQL